MAGEQVFRVLTEFRFDVAHAVADSQALQTQVGRLSTAADDALMSFRRLGVGIIAQMGLGPGGALGFLTNAVQASEKFAQSQRNIANILLSNQGLVKGQGMNFVDAMRQAEGIMKTIENKALDFALDPNSLLDQAKSIAPMLISHGLDDQNMTKSIDISRGLLKSAPTLAIDPNELGGQLVRTVQGQASMGDTLFTRLMSETKAFRDAGIKDSKKFNTMDAHKRLELLRQSLLQFGSNADVLRGNVESLNGQIQRFKNLMLGQFSIFKDLGTAVAVPLKKVLAMVNSYITTEGRKIVGSFTKMIRDLIKDPEKLLENLLTLRKLQSDVSGAGKTLAIIGLVHGVTAALKFFGISISVGIMPILKSVGGLAMRFVGFLGAIGAFSFAFRALLFMITKVAAPLAALTFFFQIFSRAVAKAEISNMKWIANNMSRLMELFERLKSAVVKIFAPIEMAMEFWSDLIAWFFKLDVSGNILLGLFAKIVETFEGLGAIVAFVVSVIDGAINAIVGTIFNIMQGNFGSIGKDIGKNFQEAFDDRFSKFYQRTPPGDSGLPTASHITQIGKVEINQQFKEQMEPDRIAFTVKETILKAAINPGQAGGRSLRSAIVAQ